MLKPTNIYFLLLALAFLYYLDLNSIFDRHRLLNFADKGPQGELAEAFLHGQLSLLSPADPRLDHSLNPWLINLRDPKAQFPWDYSYYRAKGAEKGKIYLYFGPALLLEIPFKLMTGKWLSQSAAFFIIAYLNLILYVYLLHLLILKFEFRVPLSFQVLLIFLYASCNMLNYLMVKSQIYDLAIGFATTFQLAFFVLVLLALSADRRPYLYLFMASFCVGFSFLSRGTGLVLYPFFLFLVWFIYRKKASEKGFSPVFWAGLLSLFLPAGLIMTGYLVYNDLRFENAFEFGLKYQLTDGYNYSHLLFSPSFILDSLWYYYFEPWVPLNHPPYFDSRFVPLFPSLSLTRHRENDTGLFTLFPILFTAFFWLVYVSKLPATPQRSQLIFFGSFLSGWWLVLTLFVSCWCAAFFCYEIELELPLLILQTICLLSFRHQQTYRGWLLVLFFILTLYSLSFGLLWGTMGGTSWLHSYFYRA